MRKPHIVVLDGHAINPGDLDWRALEALGTLSLFARSRPEEIVPRAADADIVLTNKAPLTAETIGQLPRLRCIAVLATGYNVVDVQAARARGIPVTNVPSYGTLSVAQHVFALLLELTQRVGHHGDSVRTGRWAASADWCYWDGPLIELAGLQLGIVGAGRIGSATARIGEAFGMTVRMAGRRDGRAALEELLRASDVVSLHCPLTPETRHLINRETLAWFKPTAFLINTSRGPLIDEDALAEALSQNALAGAALDVLAVEPPPSGHPLTITPHCIITPHIAWATVAARRRLMATAVDNVRAFLTGRAQNVVN